MFHKKKNYWFLGGIVILILIISFFIYVAWAGKSLVWQWQNLQDYLVLVSSGEQGQNINTADKLEIGQDILNDINSEINDLGLFAYIPGLRSNYLAVRDLFKRSEWVIIDFINLERQYQEIVGEGGDQYLLSKYLQQTNTKEFADELKLVSQRLENIYDQSDYILSDLKVLQSSSLFRSQSDNIEKLINTISAWQDSLLHGYELLQIAPAFVGQEEAKTYLLLFQNNHELRATGGFIGSYGILKIKNGRVTELFTDDIYHLDSEVIGELEIEPPDPISRYLDVKYWYMRDANWSPDFPTSAQKVMQFYHWEGGTEELDGVIAITPKVVSDLIAVTGDLILESVLYQAENFTNILQYEVEQNYDAREVSHWDRKDVIGELAEVILSRLFSMTWSETAEVVNSLHGNLENKNILLYAKDSQIQNYLQKRNWAGQIRSTDKDYLMVVDSNMAAFKTNQHITRSINYTTEKKTGPTGGQYLLATVKIKYDHSGNFSWDSTRYRTYTRILVPTDSVLVDWQGAMANDRTTEPGTIDIGFEKGKKVFGTFIAIEPGQTGELVFQYRLPTDIVDNYSLLYQKQPGITDLLQINFFNNQQYEFKVENDIKIKSIKQATN